MMVVKAVNLLGEIKYYNFTFGEEKSFCLVYNHDNSYKQVY